MVCASVQHRGDEYVAWPRTLAEFRAGSMTAVPLVHPWGNRLERWRYRVGRREVDLRGLDLPTDPNGLPIHGNLRGAALRGRAAYTKTTARASSPGSTTARGPTCSRAFPFPHVVTVDARLDERALGSQPRSSRPVAPRCRSRSAGTPSCDSRRARAQWELRWPACEHVLVDERFIPTGELVAQPRERAPLGPERSTIITRSVPTAVLALRRPAQGRAAVRPDLPVRAALRARPRRLRRDRTDDREIDALGRGTAPLVAPGETFRAWFTIACT